MVLILIISLIARVSPRYCDAAYWGKYRTVLDKQLLFINFIAAMAAGRSVFVKIKIYGNVT